MQSFTRGERVFFLNDFLYGVNVFGVHIVVLNLYFLRLGYRVEDVGVFNAVGILTLAVVGLSTGVVSSRWRIRSVMLAGIAVTMIGNILLPAGILVTERYRDVWIMLAMIVRGIGLAVYVVKVPPLLMDLSTAEHRSRAFAVWASVGMLSSFAGSFLGGLLPGFFGAVLDVSLDHPAPYALALVGSAIFAVISFFGMLRLDSTDAEIPSETRGGTSSRDQEARDGNRPLMILSALFLFMVLRVLGAATVFTFINVYLDEILHTPTAVIGVLWSTGMLIAAPVALSTPMLIRRFGHRATYIAATAASALGIFVSGAVPHVAVAAVGFITFNAATFVARTAFLVLAQEMMPRQWRSALSGTLETAAAVAFTIVGFAGGPLITAIGYRLLFFIGAAAASVGAFLFWRYMRRPPSARGSEMVGAGLDATTSIERGDAREELSGEAG